VPQGRDPYDVLGDPRGRAALNLIEFKGELRRALAHADLNGTSRHDCDDGAVREHDTVPV
jgi:hypothetical protein